MRSVGEPTEQRAQPSGEVKTVQRAIDLLKVVGASEIPLGVNEIARRVGRHTSVVSRTLSTLELNGFVERKEETGRFVLGLELIGLAGRVLTEIDVVRESRPYLKDLAEATKETASLTLWNRTEAITVEYVLGPGAISHVAAPGSRNPAHCTATGKAILAHLSRTAINEIVALGLKAYTDRTITDPRELEEELSRIRDRGYAVNAGEYATKTVSIASPIFDIRGNVAASISVTMPEYYFSEKTEPEIAKQVMAAAAGVSRRLGYRDPEAA